MGRLVGNESNSGAQGGGHPEPPSPPGSFCSSHASKHGFLSQAWICIRHYIYTPQQGMEVGAEVKSDR